RPPPKKPQQQSEYEDFLQTEAKPATIRRGSGSLIGHVLILARRNVDCWLGPIVLLRAVGARQVSTGQRPMLRWPSRASHSGVTPAVAGYRLGRAIGDFARVADLGRLPRADVLPACGREGAVRRSGTPCLTDSVAPVGPCDHSDFVT